MKGNLTARYPFDVAGGEAFLQGAVVHVGDRKSDLRLAEREILGDLDAYTTVDVSAGTAATTGRWTCTSTTCSTNAAS